MRIKRGTYKKQKHSKVLKQAKGYRMSYSKLYRRAREAVMHAGQYSFMHRRRRRSQKKQEWVQTISAALKGSKYSYSAFSKAMKDSKVEIDKKNLSEMILNHPEHFEALVQEL